jgi:hypothetical protein
MDDAAGKLTNLLSAPHRNMGLISDWNNGTIDRVVDIMTLPEWEPASSKWSRSPNWRYRNQVARAKYPLVKNK